MHPAERTLVTRDLYPHRVNKVGRYDPYFRHGDMVMPINGKRVGVHVIKDLFRLLLDKLDGISLDHEIIVQ